MLKDGAVAKDVYQHVHDFLASKSQTLADALTKTIGYSVS